MAADRQSIFDPTKPIDDEQFGDYATAVEYFVETDIDGAVTVLRIIKKNPVINNDRIQELYREEAIRRGWHESIFKIPSNRQAETDTEIYRKGINALLNWMYWMGYVTKPEKKRGGYVITDRGVEAISTKNIAPKANFVTNNLIQSIIKEKQPTSDEEMIRYYAEKNGFEPTGSLRDEIIARFRNINVDDDSSQDSDNEGGDDGMGDNGDSNGPCTKKPNLILYGPPGTGKTYRAKRKAVEMISGRNDLKDEEYDNLFIEYSRAEEERIRVVTFHQSFSYEDFICGVFPDVSSGDLSYKIRIGSFLDFCYPALQKMVDDTSGEKLSTAKIEEDSKDDTKVFIIDEINRGNISSIFGELMTLIEGTKRLGCKDETRSIIPTLGVKIGIPKNIKIIGTMNTADKSLVYLDAALRRRFRFEEIMPDYKEVKDFEGVRLNEIAKEINRRIEVLLDRDHQIGHAEFMGINSLTALQDVFAESIIPLLQDYFFEDYTKIVNILSIKGKPNESKFIKIIEDSTFENGTLVEITDKRTWTREDFNSIVEANNGQ